MKRRESLLKVPALMYSAVGIREDTIERTHSVCIPLRMVCILVNLDGELQDTSEYVQDTF